jgi:hypothetical protein
MTAYLMRSEQKSLEGFAHRAVAGFVLRPFLDFTFKLIFACCADALESLRQCCENVCPNDGFLDQVEVF